MRDDNITHVQLEVIEKDKLLAIKKKFGYASIGVVIKKLIEKLGDKSL